jgi:hypothetical protein
MKRIVFGVLAATLALLVIAVPALAAYWAYLVIEETNGTTYSDLPVIALRNVTQLANYGIITSTGLDTRVLTGDGAVLPHMLADDRVLTVTDLAALEKKQLIFYAGATSLSSFKIIVGYGGNITTSDVDELEMGYVTEVLASGYFNAANGSDKNILYKDDAFRMWISAANTLRVAALNSTGDEQWELHYSNFTTGYHTVYVVCNGLGALLYVDSFDIAKDTAELVDAVMPQLTTSAVSGIEPQRRQVVYANGVYWAFGLISGSLYYWTSSDGGITWSAGTSIPYSGTGVTAYHSEINIWEQDDYAYLAVIASHSGYPYSILYRRGYLEGNETITWGANWSQIDETAIYGPSAGYLLSKISLSVDKDGYPIILGTTIAARYFFTIKSSTKNTWTMAGGYPQSWSYSPLVGGTSIAAYANTTSNKMYAVWSYKETNYAELSGRYYYAGSWYGIQTIVPYSATYDIDAFSLASDMGDNLYIVYHLSTGGIYLIIRYSDGSWGSATLLSATGMTPNVSYDVYTGHIYVIYQYGGAIIGRCIAAGEISVEHILYIPAAAGTLSAMIYPDENAGALFYSSSDKTCYLNLEFSWLWNDNDEDWYWMMNNSMPYADLLEIAVNGTIHLKYELADIVHGNTMPDSSNATGNDGIVNWGENPPGVSAYLTPIESDEGSPAPTIAPIPGGTTPGDMVGPTGQPGTSQTLPTLPSNPLYPFLSPLATLSGIPLGIMWILFATFLVVVAMLLTYKYVPHLFMTILVGCGLTAFFYHMGIYPFWVVIIVAIGGFAAIIAERMPSVD